MRKINSNVILRQQTINKAAKHFLTGDKEVRRRCIEKMLDDQPAIVHFLQHLTESYDNKVVIDAIIQLLAILYTAVRFQKIKVKSFKFSKIMKSLEVNAQMKMYFHSGTFEFDQENFNEYCRKYKQRETLDYIHFAITKEFQRHLSSNEDAVFMFYTTKAVFDVLAQHFK